MNTSISNDSILLLEFLFNTELINFVRENTRGAIAKQIRMDDCKDSIIEFMIGYPNAIFVIKNTTKNNKSSMTIVISNIKEINDHIKKYMITISQSCETFKVEQVIGYNEPEEYRTIIHFDKSKL